MQFTDMLVIQDEVINNQAENNQTRNRAFDLLFRIPINICTYFCIIISKLLILLIFSCLIIILVLIESVLFIQGKYSIPFYEYACEIQVMSAR